MVSEQARMHTAQRALESIQAGHEMAMQTMPSSMDHRQIDATPLSKLYME